MSATSTPSKLVAIVHTSPLSVGPLTELFAELGPGVRLRHVVDEGLLAEVRAHGEPTPGVRARLAEHLHEARAAGANLVLSACSSLGEVVDDLAPGLGIPVVKIDAAMARDACRHGSVGVVATLATTLGPTRRLIEATARAAGSPVRVETRLVEGAFEALAEGDAPRHHRLVGQALRALAGEVDALVCAQGSTAAVVPQLGDLGVPVLTSPRGGVAHALAVLRDPARA